MSRPIQHTQALSDLVGDGAHASDKDVVTLVVVHLPLERARDERVVVLEVLPLGVELRVLVHHHARALPVQIMDVFMSMRGMFGLL